MATNIPQKVEYSERVGHFCVTVSRQALHGIRRANKGQGFKVSIISQTGRALFKPGRTGDASMSLITLENFAVVRSHRTTAVYNILQHLFLGCDISKCLEIVQGAKKRYRAVSWPLFYEKTARSTDNAGDTPKGHNDNHINVSQRTESPGLLEWKSISCSLRLLGEICRLC